VLLGVLVAAMDCSRRWIGTDSGASAADGASAFRVWVVEMAVVMLAQAVSAAIGWLETTNCLPASTRHTQGPLSLAGQYWSIPWSNAMWRRDLGHWSLVSVSIHTRGKHPRQYQHLQS
jgi:hypothetical protein